MNNDLPNLQKRPMHRVLPLITKVLSRPGGGNILIRLVDYGDGHYRAIFDMRYFDLNEGADRPSRSQWTTLKKRFKRHNSDMFIFKETGYVDCSTVSTKQPIRPDTVCCYIDFGFFAH